MEWGIVRVKETGSTNADLAEMARNGAPEGLVLVAERQTAGRGRQGRTWLSRPGDSLCFSLLLRPTAEPAKAASLSILAGVAVAEALEGLMPGVAVSVKWPNDVLANDRKICGILCEMGGGGGAMHVIVGIGVNVNLDTATLPPEVAATATSMRREAGRTFEPDAVLSALLEAFGARYGQWLDAGLASSMPFLDAHDWLRGRPVAMHLLNEPLSGIGRGISPDGALLLETAGGTVAEVYSGEAHLGLGGQAR